MGRILKAKLILRGLAYGIGALRDLCGAVLKGVLWSWLSGGLAARGNKQS
jgi:hypothetical protein